MKPPVEAPTSSARRPAGSIPKASSAFASLMPPRDTYGGASATATSASSATSSPGLRRRAGRPRARRRRSRRRRPGSATRTGRARPAECRAAACPRAGEYPQAANQPCMTTLLVGVGGHARRAVPLRHLAADAPHRRARVVHGRHQHRRAASCWACWWPSTGSTATSARPSESGFLGGFTTFSTFSVQIVLEVDSGEPGARRLVPARVRDRRRGGRHRRLRAGPQTGMSRASVRHVTHTALGQG